MFKKMFATVGIGSAKVDTIVRTEEIYPNSIIDLEIVIEGGSSEQDLNGLTLALFTSAKKEVDFGDEDVDMYTSVLLTQFEVPLENSVIQPNEKITIECQMHIHPETPITAFENSPSSVWIETGLDIQNGVDSGDKDYLDILLPEMQQKTLEALEQLGYDLFKVDTEQGTVQSEEFSSTTGCYQEFEFRKSKGFFSTQEIEITFVPLEEEVGILIEIDRTFGGESYMSVVIPMDADAEGIYNWFEESLSSL
jgi:sporulation-control protein